MHPDCLRSGNQIMLASYLGLCLHANEIIRVSTIYSCAIWKQVKHVFCNHQVLNFLQKIWSERKSSDGENKPKKLGIL